MTVDVCLVDDNTRHTGTITMVTSLIVDGELLTDTMPSIRLDDGRTIDGLSCWWTPIIGKEGE